MSRKSARQKLPSDDSPCDTLQFPPQTAINMSTAIRRLRTMNDDVPASSSVRHALQIAFDRSHERTCPSLTGMAGAESAATRSNSFHNETSWKCPACQHPIRHSDANERPRLDTVYRCHVCRLELIVDSRSGKLTTAPPRI